MDSNLKKTLLLASSLLMLTLPARSESPDELFVRVCRENVAAMYIGVMIQNERRDVLTIKQWTKILAEIPKKIRMKEEQATYIANTDEVQMTCGRMWIQTHLTE